MGIQDTTRVIVQCEFEVFGHVQGLSFTKFCRDLCIENGIVGWVKNSKKGTILGKMQGPKVQIDNMVDWLTNIGSPGSKIEKCDFTNWGTLSRMDYKEFSIRF